MSLNSALNVGGLARAGSSSPSTSTFDRAQAWPVCDVEIIHRRPPAEDVVADEESRHHADYDGHECDAGKGRQFAVELLDRDRRRLRERGLDEVVKRSKPAVDRN